MRILFLSKVLEAKLLQLPMAYSDPCQTSKMGHFAKLVNSVQNAPS